jgi:DNA-nicking Smr family endonuclease
MGRRRRRDPVFDVRDSLLDDAPVATIDLHRHTTAEVRERLKNELMLLSRRHRGGIVHVITGRGKHSDGPAVLRPFVRSLLKGSLRGFVADVSDDIDEAGYRIRLA